MSTRPNAVLAEGAREKPAASAGLPSVRAISLLPAAELQEEDGDLESSLTKALLALAALPVPVRLYGIVALTSRAEWAFARACLNARLPLSLLLPASPGETEKMLPDVDAASIREVIAAAFAVRVVADGAQGEAGMNDCRVAAFLEGPLLLAFNRDQDGQFQLTAVELARAKEFGLEILGIDAKTGLLPNSATEILRPSDAELQFLAEHSDPLPLAASASPREQAHAWFERLDARAATVAPNLRRLAATPVLFSASAAVLSVANVLANGSWLLPALSMALGLVAFWTPRLVKTRMRQTRWVRLRVAAEFCRSHLALWETGEATDPLLIESAPELAGMLRTLDFLKLTSGAPRPSFADFKGRYGRARVRHQMAYLRLHHRRGQRQMDRYSRIAGLAVKGGLLVNIASFILAVAPTPVWMEKPIAIGILAPLCFQAAAVAGALIAVNDFRRRTQRYQELQEKLAVCARGLAASQTWPGALAVAHRVERLLLAEVLEFRTLYRHIAIHK